VPSTRPLRRALGATLAFAFLPLLGLHAQQDAGAALPIPQEWSTHYVVLLEQDSAYRAPSDSAAQAVLQAHIQYQLRAQADGRSIVAGPFAPAAGDRLVGMTVVRADSAAAAERWAAADPAVQAGRFRATVRAWTTPAGRLP
jgi:uncharacterized protein YciI